MIENITFDDQEKWITFKSAEQYEKVVGFTGKINDIEVSLSMMLMNDEVFVSIVDQISGYGLAAVQLSVEEMFKCNSKQGRTEVFIDAMIKFSVKVNDDVRHEIEKKRFENIILDEPAPLSVEEKIGLGIIK